MKLWIARNESGLIAIYKRKPYKKYDFFTKSWRWSIDNSSGDYMCLLDSYFPEVTFNNSPQEVELILCNRHIDIINIQDCNPKKQPCLLTNHGIETNVIFK